MKAFKLFLAVVLMFAVHANAQTVSPVHFRTTTNTLYNFSYEGTYRSTDSTTYHTVGTYTVAANEVGLLEVEVIGIDTTSSAGFCTGSKVVTYSKVAGTLTLGTPSNILATTTSANMSTSSWQITTSSNNIIVQVKGTLNRDILWTVRIKPLRKIKPS